MPLSLDIVSLLAAVTAASLSATTLLIFFRINQKTYRGFGLWVIGSLFVSLGYATLIFRPVTPLWANVLLVNLSITLATLIRTQGVLRFMSGTSFSKIFMYLYPLGMLAGMIFLLQTGATAAQRNTLLSVGILPLIGLISREFILFHPEGKRGLYFSAALINCLFCGMIMIRAIIWYLSQQHGFNQLGVINSIHFLVVIAYEIGFTVFFLLMNSQRMEQELYDAMTELKETTGKVQTLSGLLPICASCKKIRDDQGYWAQVEDYIGKHTDAVFSHGICPDCIRKLYPEMHGELMKEDK